MEYCRISLKPIKTNSKYPGYLDSEFRKLFQSIRVNPVLSFTRKDFFRQSPIKSKGMSISGVQQKLSVKIDSNKKLQITATDGEYILKPSPEIFPHASENEHCAMLTSKLLGIDTAACGLISFSDGELVYITKRFDRKDDDKIHQEDLVQGFGMKSEDKYSHSYEAAGKLINCLPADVGQIPVLITFLVDEHGQKVDLQNMILLKGFVVNILKKYVPAFQ